MWNARAPEITCLLYTAAVTTSTPPGATPHAPIVVCANQKGGVGKTTTVLNLAAELAHSGRRVLLVDLDPQRNLTSGLGFTTPPGAPTAYDLLVHRKGAWELAQPTSVPNLFLVPGSADLAGIDLELAGDDTSGERQLAVGLRTAGDAEVVLVDTPPSLGLVTVSALAVADAVLVPVQCEYYALEGLSQLMATIRLVRERLNPALQVNGFLLTMLDPRTKLGSDVVREVESHFGELVYRARVPRSVRLAEAPSHGIAIRSYAPGTPGAESYARAAEEFATRVFTTPASAARP
jgi:chromosome partitioning protein